MLDPNDTHREERTLMNEEPWNDGAVEVDVVDVAQDEPEDAPVESLSFREAMAELESIVEVLEDNSLELEDSLARYARGVSLLSSLQKRLANAEQQIDVLMGELVETDDAVQDTTLS